MNGTHFHPTLGANPDGSTDDQSLLNAANAVQAIDACTDNMAGGGNTTVSAFQQAWNATSDSAMGSPQLVVDGKYGPKTYAAMLQTYGSQAQTIQGPCPKYAGPPAPSPGPSPAPSPGPIAAPPPATLTTTSGLPMWAKWLLGSLAAAAILYVGWAFMKRGGHRAVGRHATRLHHAVRRHATRVGQHFRAHETRRRRRRHRRR